jgi:hypothetical protein
VRISLTKEQNAVKRMNIRMDTGVHIYDNGGDTADRYTAVYLNEPAGNGLFTARGMSDKPFHPQGFGQLCSAEDGDYLGKRIQFDNLPRDCQKLVLSDYTG